MLSSRPLQEAVRGARERTAVEAICRQRVGFVAAAPALPSPRLRNTLQLLQCDQRRLGGSKLGIRESCSHGHEAAWPLAVPLPAPTMRDARCCCWIDALTTLSSIQAVSGAV